MESKLRTFSGVQPSGNLHIGNYLGAISNWVKIQNEFESIFCIVDWHAITVPYNPIELKKLVIETAKIYLAAGIDPNKSIIFIQSQVKEHTELAWILNSVVARMGDLEKMTQFKDKSQKKGIERSSVGLFDYPVLMAADILLYDTTVVPVGEDQLQHIELTRVLARRFNKKFSEIFTIPQAKISKTTRRIMSLNNPQVKMSKSAESEYSYIALLDPPELVEKKIRKAVTDSGSSIEYSDKKPALKNLINIYSAFTAKDPQVIVEEYRGKGYADFKSGLTREVLNFLNSFQRKYNSLNDKEVAMILDAGKQKAQYLAEIKMQEIRKATGLR